MFKKKVSLLLLPLATTLSLHAANPFNDPFFSDPFGDDIFKEMFQMQKDMDKMFERMHHRMMQRSSGTISPLGTYKMAVGNQLVDKGDHYELATNIPESKENHIDINTANGMMNITAKIVQQKEEKSQYGVSQSRSVRVYQQSTALPSDADDAAIKTIYKGGKLVVSIGKKVGRAAIHTVAPVQNKVTVKPAVKVEKSRVVSHPKESSVEQSKTVANEKQKEVTSQTVTPAP